VRAFRAIAPVIALGRIDPASLEYPAITIVYEARARVSAALLDPRKVAISAIFELLRALFAAIALRIGEATILVALDALSLTVVAATLDALSLALVARPVDTLGLTLVALEVGKAALVPAATFRALRLTLAATTTALDALGLTSATAATAFHALGLLAPTAATTLGLLAASAATTLGLSLSALSTTLFGLR
jgi:hypothetical protein